MSVFEETFGVLWECKFEAGAVSTPFLAQPMIRQMKVCMKRADGVVTQANHIIDGLAYFPQYVYSDLHSLYTHCESGIVKGKYFFVHVYNTDETLPIASFF